MRIFFIGTVSFSEKALSKLILLNAQIVAVATKSQSKFNADHVDLAPLCKKNDIPVKYVKDINAPHIIDWITSFNADVIFCFGWSSLLGKDILSLTPKGVIGFHPTNLPRNRGRHPIIWSLVLGLKSSATTFFFMNEGSDEGDILSQKNFRINYEDNAESVYKKVESNALEQIESFLPALSNGNNDRVKQDLEIGNVWRKRGILDGLIDFRMTSFGIYNLVRALTKPYIGAHLNYKGQEIKIWKVKEEIFDGNDIEPGKVLESRDNKILVKTFDMAIRIMEHEFTELPKEGEYL